MKIVIFSSCDQQWWHHWWRTSPSIIYTKIEFWDTTCTCQSGEGAKWAQTDDGMSETEWNSQREDVRKPASMTRWSVERLNEVLHRLIKSTKATKIYRDDRTFTFLKLEISVLERKTKCSVRIIPGLGEGGEIKKKNKTRKRLIIPFIFILKVFVFIVVVVLICGRKEHFF